MVMEAGKTPYAKIKDELKYYLETQKQVAVLKKLTQSLMKTADIKYIDPEYNPTKAIKIVPEQKEENTKK